MNTLNSVTGQDLQRLAREREAQTREVGFWVKIALVTVPIVPVCYWLRLSGTSIRSVDALLRLVSEDMLLLISAALSAGALAWTCRQIAIAERHPGRIPTFIAGLYYFVVIGLISGFLSCGFVVVLKIMGSMSV